MRHYSSQTVVDNSNLKAYQAKLLSRLKEIRESIGDGDAGAIKKERDAAIDENTRLKKELERANYRINHLIKELNKAEEIGSSNAPLDKKQTSTEPSAAPQEKKTMLSQMSASFNSIFG